MYLIHIIKKLFYLPLLSHPCTRIAPVNYVCKSNNIPSSSVADLKMSGDRFSFKDNPAYSFLSMIFQPAVSAFWQLTGVPVPLIVTECLLPWFYFLSLSKVSSLAANGQHLFYIGDWYGRFFHFAWRSCLLLLGFELRRACLSCLWLGCCYFLNWILALSPLSRPPLFPHLEFY